MFLVQNSRTAVNAYLGFPLPFPFCRSVSSPLPNRFAGFDWTFVLCAPANDEIAAPRRPMACPLHDVTYSGFTRF
jgi:hypothetical protein